MNSLLRKVFFIGLTFVMVFAVAACSTGAATTAAPATTEASVATKAPAKQIKVGLVISDASNPVFVAAINAMQAKADEIGVNFSVCDEKASVPTLVSCVENFISAKENAIIIQNLDETSGLDVMKKALDAGITVIAYDQKVDPAYYNYYFGVDNTVLGKAIGAMAGKWANANLGGKAVVGVCTYPSIPFIVERSDGMVAGLMEVDPEAKVVVTASCALTPDGVTQGENFLQAHPDMNVVVGINDAGVLGVYQAFKAAGKTDANIGIFGCDATADGVAAIKEGGIYRGSIWLNMNYWAVQMLQYGVDSANGITHDKKDILFDAGNMTVVDKSNVDTFNK